MDNPLIQKSEEPTSTPAPESTEQQSSTPEGGQETKPEGGESSEEAPKYDVEGFNKHFGSEFTDESSLKNILDSSKKLTDYESRFTSMEKELEDARGQAAKYNEFVDYFQPEKFFGDEETWREIETRKKFKDKDPAVVHQIQSSTFDSLSDIDKLILADKLKVGGNLPDSVRVQGLLKKFNIEADDLSELTDIDKYAIASAVADQKEMFDEIRNFKPDPVKYDIVAEKDRRAKELETRKTELQNKWKPLAESLLKNYKEAKAFTKNDKGESEEAFKYSADENFKTEFLEPLMLSIGNSNLEPTEENVASVNAYIDQQYKILNFDRIVSEAVKYGKTMSAEATHKEIHNDKPQNTNEAPPTSGEGVELTLKEWAKKRMSAKK